MKTAILISTYNWPEALDLVLKSLNQQSRFPDEVLIADDGSGDETRTLITRFADHFKIPVKHIWQEDQGFRKSVVLNKAIASSTADYIIQIDGDCIMHKHFIGDHLAGLKKKTFLFGSRVNIKPGAVSEVLNEKKYEFSLFSKAIKNKTRNLRVPLFQQLYKESSEFSRKTRGCNLSYWRNDFLAVNGYDENMEGWGREDSELVLRMLNSGIKGKRLRYGGILYHICHPEKSKAHLEENDQIQELTIQQKKTWSKNGVDKYLTKYS
jgi:hypothetical protein